MKNRKGQRRYGRGRGLAGLALAGAVAALAGCTSKNVDDRPPVAAVEGPLGAYEETLVCGMGRSTIANPKFPQDDSYEDNAYTRYLKDVLNVQVVDDFEANGADYDRQVSLSVAAGELPDVMKVGSKDLLDELVENDLVADLTEVYEAYASDYIKDVYDSYGGRCLDLATYNGRLMAIPGTNLDSAPCVAYIRKDWLEKTGVEADPDRSEEHTSELQSPTYISYAVLCVKIEGGGGGGGGGPLHHRKGVGADCADISGEGSGRNRQSGGHGLCPVPDL